MSSVFGAELECKGSHEGCPCWFQGVWEADVGPAWRDLLVEGSGSVPFFESNPQISFGDGAKGYSWLGGGGWFFFTSSGKLSYQAFQRLSDSSFASRRPSSRARSTNLFSNRFAKTIITSKVPTAKSVRATAACTPWTTATAVSKWESARLKPISYAARAIVNSHSKLTDAATYAVSWSLNTI